MISIVTITYNNFSELKQTYESVKDLPPSLFEFVVINGGQCAQTSAYLTNLKKSRPHFLYCEEPDTGIANAFNKGLNLSTGSSVMFLNSGDVLIRPSYMYWVNRYFDQTSHSADFVHADIIFADQLGGKLWMRPTHQNLGRGMPYWHQTMVVKRVVFDTIGGFNETYKIAMDYEFVCRMSKAGFAGLYCDTGAVVEMDGGGVSVTSEKKGILESQRALSENQMYAGINQWGFFTRLGLFYGRTLLAKLGLQVVVKKIKQLKHGKLGHDKVTEDFRINA